ncbi:hypothetical protein HA402_010484 [Bradysia odoriphaga]|nr:hypothetical protein HA402_010484 [Bradysia odoriphaga]
MHRDSLRNGNGNNRGTTESDAAHIRFRERGPTQVYQCSSCHRPFEASNKAEIMEHFENNVHRKIASDCLYCQGAVFQYRTVRGEAEFYHNCLPYKKMNSKLKNKS